MLDGLNDQQRQAVQWNNGHALVLAGAGSGKTRVLTTRLAWCVETQGVSPHRLMAVTFTNKAAKELQGRVEKLLGETARRVWIGTFHGLAHRILRYHAQAAGLPEHFQIMDEADQKSVLKRIYQAENWDDKVFPMLRLLRFIQGVKETGKVELKEVMDAAADEPWLVQGFSSYQNYCQAEGLVDFAELLIRSIQLLERVPEIAERYAMRFQHILIDEFQDIAPLQYRWLTRLIGANTAVMAVGDDDQTIYGFRGASVDGMQRFLLDYAPVQLFKLEQNYRSVKSILKASNALIAHNASRLGKELWTEHEQGESILMAQAESEESEARGVIRWVQQALKSGVKANDIAILYRTNVQSRPLEQALMQARIPYKIYGGMRFFERAEIRLAVAYLRVAQSLYDTSALIRMIQTPSRGIGEKTIELAQRHASEQGISLWEALLAQSSQGGRSGKVLAAFVGCVQRLLEIHEKEPFPNCVSAIIAASGLIEHYREKGEEERIEHLLALTSSAQQFNPEIWRDMEPDAPRVSDLALFLGQASLDSDTEGQSTELMPSIQLMTVHAAKGLEFARVALVGLEEGLFPHENCLANEVEEERRLMYVAMTRAEEHLLLSYARSRMIFGQLRYAVPSRFLKEIPSTLFERFQVSQWGDWLKTDTKMADTEKSLSYSSAGYAQDKAAASPKDKALTPWKAGQVVFHTTLGEGCILKVEPVSEYARLHVRFKRHGEKWLDSRYAPLAAVD